jgi:UDP-N-acetylmuramyl pentapeptide phosphotransferase/UDP-N-acetylglucosamine-1-phosphate transferase
MTGIGNLAFGAWATVMALVVAVAAASGRRLVRVRTATNHRGRQVPLSLGYALAIGYGIPSAAVALGVFSSDAVDRAAGWDWIWFLLAMGLVFGAGLYDDRQSTQVHGVRAHLGELAAGRVTSGIVKILAALVAATMAVVAAGAAGWALVVAILLVAGTTNLVNVLDVAPGRALKCSFVGAVLVLLVEPTRLGWATAGQAAALLPFDVRERGMLGDAGANLLGFVLGFTAFASLSTSWMTAALVVVLLLNALAETVTLTRIIHATPPLRWLDDLWRIPVEDPRVG